MASLCFLGGRIAKKITPVLMKHANCSAVAVRKAGYWNRDWMPGPYPKTPEERAAAAKKYNLRVEDYEPYPDDGEGYGDYPMLPRVSGEGRDPYESYDMPELKRNFNEPMHVDFDAMLEHKWSPDVKPVYPYWVMATAFVGMFGSFIIFYLANDKYRIVQPRLAKQLPYQGKVHYTFELEDGSSSK